MGRANKEERNNEKPPKQEKKKQPDPKPAPSPTDAPIGDGLADNARSTIADYNARQKKVLDDL